jgi:NADPH2:quinone reductase
MKAIRVHEFGTPEVLRLEDAPDPQPVVGQVVVRVAAVGVNPVEAYVRAGGYAGAPAVPYIPGTDAAGTVVTVGEPSDGTGSSVRTQPAADGGSPPAAGHGDAPSPWQPGTRVYVAGSLSGTYAELTLCSIEQVHPLPDKVSFAQGAALGVPYATAFRALFQRAHALPGETILVHGASGGVGLAAVQLAVAAGLCVFGTAGSEVGRRLVAEQGAAHVFDHTDSGYANELLRLTAGRGVNVILEMAAHTNLGRDAGLLAIGGRVVIIGSRGPIEVNPRDLMSRDAQILGMLLNLASPVEYAQIHAALHAGLANGTLRPVIEKELPLAEAAQAHHEVMERKAGGKIVLVP